MKFFLEYSETHIMYNQRGGSKEILRIFNVCISLKEKVFITLKNELKF